MTYRVDFTEADNPAKPPLVVQDQSLNTQTSLSFVGQNYSGYGKIIAEDFLHLLENFASPTAPSNPVEGQLWYNTEVSTLYVWDSTTWNTAGSLKKSTTSPEVANSLQGDLWVDTANSQLYLFSGSNWLLVGPQYSQGTLTGPVVENIVDTNNVPHSVISNYASNASTNVSYRISIISKDTFTPKLSVPGFTTINQGVNLSTVDSTNTASLTRFWGIAQQADALLVGNTTVPSANFLRSDTSSVSNFPISIRNAGGLTVGTDLSFNIGTSGSSTVFYNRNSGSNISFQLNSGVRTQTTLYLDSTGKIGVGLDNTSPASTLDVAGLITASTGLNVTGDTNSTSLTTGSIKTQGGLAVALNSNFGGTVTTYGNVLVNNLVGGNPSAGAVLLPGSDSATGLYDIGSSSRRFRNIYAQSFIGTFNGSFTGSLAGSVNGSAAKLASPTQFSLIGDVSSNVVSFDGQSSSSQAIFTTTVGNAIITNKVSAADTTLTDEFLMYRPGTGLLKTTKQTLLNHVATMPVGCVMPFAGTVIPTGYLLCDGSELPISTYSVLFGVIGYTYKAAVLLQGLNTFAIPDLRGRFPLGRDNMSNGLTVPYKDGSGTQISAGGGAANRVSDVTADIVGTGSGAQQVTLTTSNLPDHKHSLKSDSNTQYYAVGVQGAPSDPYSAGSAVKLAADTGTGVGQALANSGSIIATQTGASINIMNPYETINYIIFTGVI
jgi:microcystin-dependent protein